MTPSLTGSEIERLRELSKRIESLQNKMRAAIVDRATRMHNKCGAKGDLQITFLAGRFADANISF